MAEYVEVRPLRQFPHYKNLNPQMEIGTSLEGVAVARYNFPNAQVLDGIPTRLISREYYLDDATVVLHADKFQIDLVKLARMMNGVGPFGKMQTFQHKEYAHIEVPYTHARNEGGFRIAVPVNETFYLCDLIPPERKPIFYSVPTVQRPG